MDKKKRIVIKVGTSSLTYDTGKINIRKIELLAQVISDLCHSGCEVALVTSSTPPIVPELLPGSLS